MDYNVFFQKLDGLLSDKRMDEAEQLLIDNVKKAMEQEDTQALLTVSRHRETCRVGNVCR